MTLIAFLYMGKILVKLSANGCVPRGFRATENERAAALTAPGRNIATFASTCGMRHKSLQINTGLNRSAHCWAGMPPETATAVALQRSRLPSASCHIARIWPKKPLPARKVCRQSRMFIKVSTYPAVTRPVPHPSWHDRLYLQICLWWFLGAVALCCASSYSQSAEFTAADVKAMDFDIPSEPLASALQDFSQRSGVELLYESAITEGLKSPALKGDFTPREALRRLLSGTDVVVHYNLHNAVSLSAPEVAGWSDQPDHSMGSASLSLAPLNVVAGGGPNDEDMREFSDALQNDVSTALTRNPDIRSGNYRIRVKLWIDPSREIRRAQVTETTGDSGRDAAIVDTLQGLMITRAPPSGLAQPVRVIVAVNSP